MSASDRLTPPGGDGAAPAETAPRRLGLVVGGSLKEGLEVKLDPDRSLEEMAVGRYVTIQGRDLQGRSHRFFGMVTDVKLASLHQGLTQAPVDADPFLGEVYAGTATYGLLHVTPLLVSEGTADAALKPVKTVPSHFSVVYGASEQDVERIFGEEDPAHFVIGAPLDMDVKVRLNYERFIERSVGVFGKTGTGKTFLTRLILASLIQKSNAQTDPARKAVNLVFDMHSEYGWSGTSEGPTRVVKGLKQLFGASVSVFALDEESARRRGVSADGVVTIGLADIEPEDLAILRESLNLTPLAVEAAYSLARHFRQPAWIRETLALEGSDEGTRDLLRALNIADSTFVNLRRGLDKIRRLEFVREERVANAAETILNYLQGGRNVVLEFGRFGSNLAAYVLVANVLTRRICERYRAQTEAAGGDPAREPIHLVITIEEAHKFLNPDVAGQTIFGEVAREMRKFNATLLVVDQRPSAIDAEVLSQVGTKIACLLDNEKDMEAVFSGVSGSRELRGVLARLESKQQALIFGHAVPMPVVVRVEEYGPETYDRFLDRGGARPAGGSLRERLTADLYPDEESPAS